MALLIGSNDLTGFSVNGSFDCLTGTRTGMLRLLCLESGTVTAIKMRDRGTFGASKFFIADDALNVLGVSAGVAGASNVDIAGVVSVAVTAGEYYYLGRRTASFGFDYYSNDTYGAVKGHTGGTYAEPSATVSPVTDLTGVRLFTIWAEGDAAPAGPTITNINGDDTVIQGSTGNNILTALATVTSLTIGGIAVTLTSVDANNSTWPMPGFVDGAAYPVFGTVTASINAGEDTQDVTLSMAAGYTARTMGTLSAAGDSISTLAAAQGLTMATGGILYNSSGLTTYDDSTISDATDGTHVLWYRAPTTNVMTQINLVVSGGVIVRKITARAMTLRALTMDSLTARAV